MGETFQCSHPEKHRGSRTGENLLALPSGKTQEIPNGIGRSTLLSGETQEITDRREISALSSGKTQEITDGTKKAIP